MPLPPPLFIDFLLKFLIPFDFELGVGFCFEKLNALVFDDGCLFFLQEPPKLGIVHPFKGARLDEGPNDVLHLSAEAERGEDFIDDSVLLGLWG